MKRIKEMSVFFLLAFMLSISYQVTVKASDISTELEAVGSRPSSEEDSTEGRGGGSASAGDSSDGGHREAGDSTDSGRPTGDSTTESNLPATTENNLPSDTSNPWYTTETPYEYPDTNVRPDIHIEGNDGTSEYAVFGQFFNWAKNTYVPIPYFNVTFWDIGLYVLWATIIFLILAYIIQGISDN